MDEIEKKLMEMKTGDQTNSKEMGLNPGMGFWVTRVPGGWVFNMASSSCFVPGGSPGPVAKKVAAPKKSGKKKSS